MANYSIQEILNAVVRDENGLALNTIQSSQAALNTIYDEVNKALRVTAGGGETPAASTAGGGGQVYIAPKDADEVWLMASSVELGAFGDKRIVPVNGALAVRVGGAPTGHEGNLLTASGATISAPKTRYSFSRALDGNNGTWWETYQGTPHQWSVDFGPDPENWKIISKLMLYFYSYSRPVDYTLRCSVDMPTDWANDGTLLYTGENNGVAGEHNYFFSPPEGPIRCFWMHITEVTTADIAQLAQAVLYSPLYLLVANQLHFVGVSELAEDSITELDATLITTTPTLDPTKGYLTADGYKIEGFCTVNADGGIVDAGRIGQVLSRPLAITDSGGTLNAWDAQCKNVYNISGLTDNQTFTLPAWADVMGSFLPHKALRFNIEGSHASYKIRFDPNGSEQIIGAAAGKYIETGGDDSGNASIVFIPAGPGKWMAPRTGTWNFEA